MASISNETISANLPIINLKNHDKWCKKMKVVFGYQEVLKVIKNVVSPIESDATTAQKHVHKENEGLQSLVPNTSMSSCK